MYLPDSVTLLDGTVIVKDGNEEFPPYIKINPRADIDNLRACAVCPVRALCDDNNEFDCSTYGMFQGAYWNFEDVIELCKKAMVLT